MGTRWQQKENFWLCLNFTSPCSGLNNHTFILLSALTKMCHAGFFSQRIAAVQKYSAKVLAWKIHTNPVCLRGENSRLAQTKQSGLQLLYKTFPHMTGWSALQEKKICTVSARSYFSHSYIFVTSYRTSLNLKLKQATPWLHTFFKGFLHS